MSENHPLHFGTRDDIESHNSRSSFFHSVFQSGISSGNKSGFQYLPDCRPIHDERSDFCREMPFNEILDPQQKNCICRSEMKEKGEALSTDSEEPVQNAREN